MDTIDARKLFKLVCKEMNLLKQSQVADSLNVSESELSRYIRGTAAIPYALRTQLEINSMQLILCILAEAKQRKPGGSVLKNLCFTIANKYSLIPKTHNGLMNVYDLGYEDVGELEKYFVDNFKRLLDDLSTTIPELSDQMQDTKNVPQECVTSIHKLMESFKSGVYFLKSERNEEIEMFIEKGMYTRHISETRVYSNPKLEEFSLVVRRNFEQRALLENPRHEESDVLSAREAAVRKFRDLKVLINEIPLTDYVNRYVRKFPLRANNYSSIKNFIDSGANDVFSLFEIGWNTKNNPGKVKMDMYLRLAVPMDSTQKEVEISLDYTSEHTLVVPGDGYTYRTPYPCKRLYHKFSIKPVGQWTLDVFPFEPFFNIGKLSIQGKGSTTERGGATAIVDMNHWILPGTGYMRRYYYWKESCVDAYRPEFLTYEPSSIRANPE